MFTDAVLKNEQLPLWTRVWAAHVNACMSAGGAAQLTARDLLGQIGLEATQDNMNLISGARQSCAKKGLLVVNTVVDHPSGKVAWMHLAKL